MCMSCSSTGKITKKKVIILAAIGIGIAAAMYFAFTSNNPAIAAVIPLLLIFAPCLGMCGVMGVVMWLKGRSSKNGKQTKSENPYDEKREYKIQQRKLNRGTQVSRTSQLVQKILLNKLLNASKKI
jgi:phosphate/sulfate permease